MKTPIYSSADYLGALQSLLPPGRAWPRELSSILAQSMAGLAPVYARNHARAANLLVDAFPATTYELLPEWEATLGLPDPYIDQSATAQGRRQQVISRLTAIGGQSAAYFENVAARLGYPISVSNFTPFRMGQQRMGCQLGGPDWAFAWAVDAGPFKLTSFRMGQSAMAEPLEVWGNQMLESGILKIIPAHTVVIFRYPMADAALGPFSLNSSQLG